MGDAGQVAGMEAEHAVPSLVRPFIWPRDAGEKETRF